MMTYMERMKLWLYTSRTVPIQWTNRIEINLFGLEPEHETPPYINIKDDSRLRDPTPNR